MIRSSEAVPSATGDGGPGTPHHRFRRLVALAGFWTLPPLAATIALSVRLDGDAPPVPWGRFFAGQLVVWYPWIALTPGVSRLARRWPLYGRAWGWHGLRHAAVAAVVGVGFTAYLVAFEVLGGLDPSAISGRVLLGALAGVGGAHVVVYGLVLGGVHGLDFYRRARRREAQLARARLEVLKAQLQPHFLFNALHAVSSLMEDDVPGARRMIARLSDLLRASLAADAADEVPLGEELAVVDLYLEIEKMRFPDRLEVRYAIEAEAREALVPHLALQPLVENAVRHGLGRSSAAGRLDLAARRCGELLEILVDDDGPGLEEPPPREGVGIANVRARLATLYGAAASLALRNRPEGGCRVRLELPWHTP